MGETYQCPVCSRGPEYLYRLEEVEKDVNTHRAEVKESLSEIYSYLEKQLKIQSEDFDKKFDKLNGLLNKLIFIALSLLLTVFGILLTAFLGKL